MVLVINEQTGISEDRQIRDLKNQKEMAIDMEYT
jgi:hypothetical protein